MEKNKSIDGLRIRSAQKTVKNGSTPVKTQTAHKTAKVKTSAAKKIPLTEPVEPKEIKEEIILDDKDSPELVREQTVEDFLKPVQAFDFDSETGELKAAEDSPKKSRKERKQEKKEKKKEKKAKKKPSKIRRAIGIIALLLILGVIGVIIWAVFWGNDIIAKITGGQGNIFDLLTFVEPNYEPLKTDANGRTNILAFGTSGYNMAGDEGNGVHAGAQLTDSIMMISLNQETGDIAMLSLPRDLKASPTCTATGKINEVYWCNNRYGDNEAAGANALMQEVGGILGVDFQYYAHLNWGSLITIVDILDGITITLDEGIYDYYWTGAVYEPGIAYTLNGEQALGLARARHGTTGGDFSRGASQQKILIGIKNKIFEKDLSLADIIGLASTLGDNFRSNFSVEELKSAAHLTFAFDFDSMRQISLWPEYMTTGTLDNGISYVLPRGGVGYYGAIQAYVAEYLNNDPRTYEHPTIAVLNATGEAGVASDERTELEADGYTVNTIGNAPEDVSFEDSCIIYSNGQKPGTEDLLEKRYSVKVKSFAEASASITRDYDFVILLGPTPTETETEEQD